MQSNWDTWKPPHSAYKLNFDAAVFTGLDRSGFGAVIRNDKGEVMAAMSAKGSVVHCSEEAELLACRKAIEFALDAGFTELVIKRDNSNVMHALSSLMADQYLLGNVVGEIQQMLSGLHWVSMGSRRKRWKQGGPCTCSIC